MKERVHSHVATTVALVVSFIAAGFLVASPSPSAAAAAATAGIIPCEAEVGGDHCCACGDSGSGHFCAKVAQNAYAECDNVDLCAGSCWGSVE